MAASPCRLLRPATSIRTVNKQRAAWAHVLWGWFGRLLFSASARMGLLLGWFHRGVRVPSTSCFQRPGSRPTLEGFGSCLLSHNLGSKSVGGTRPGFWGAVAIWCPPRWMRGRPLTHVDCHSRSLGVYHLGTGEAGFGSFLTCMLVTCWRNRLWLRRALLLAPN